MQLALTSAAVSIVEDTTTFSSLRNACSFPRNTVLELRCLHSLMASGDPSATRPTNTQGVEPIDSCAILIPHIHTCRYMILSGSIRRRPDMLISPPYPGQLLG